MKAHALFFSLASFLGLAAILSCGCDLFDDDDDGVFAGVVRIFGSGVVAEETRSVSGFSGIRHATQGSLQIERTGSESLLVRAEDNLLPYLDSVVTGGTLELRTEGNVDLEPTRPIVFEATATTLETVELSGVGETTAIGAMGDRLRLTVSGVGNITATSVEGNRLDSTLAGVGNMDVSGEVNLQFVDLSGEGNYDARNLASTDTEVSISGEGTVTVWATGTLDVTISGTGNVFYLGSPVVTENITGVGSVEPLTD
ncbi:MAG: DUF2807 domain-containing protein [Acidobacteriota bacterium]|nr:MAG: DUF2807 domain-containing protein [Acidobacteriota bacterium]